MHWHQEHSHAMLNESTVTLTVPCFDLCVFDLCSLNDKDYLPSAILTPAPVIAPLSPVDALITAALPDALSNNLQYSAGHSA